MDAGELSGVYLAESYVDLRDDHHSLEEAHSDLDETFQRFAITEHGPLATRVTQAENRHSLLNTAVTGLTGTVTNLSTTVTATAMTLWWCRAPSLLCSRRRGL